MVDISSLIKSIDRYKLQKLKNIILNDNPKEIYSKIKNYIHKYDNIEVESFEIIDDDIDYTEELVIPVFDKIDVSIVIPGTPKVIANLAPYCTSAVVLA